MSDQFTDTELAMIALVLNQNADEYEDDGRFVRQTATKAREMMGDDQ